MIFNKYKIKNKVNLSIRKPNEDVYMTLLNKYDDCILIMLNANCKHFEDNKILSDYMIFQDTEILFRYSNSE